MKRIISQTGLSSILVVVFILATTPSLFAQEKGTQQVQDKMSPEIESIALAKQLVQYGYDKELALPLINAAQIIIDENAGSLKVQETKRGKGKEGVTETVEITLNVEKLLTDAEAFAGDDKNIKGLVKSMRESTTASRGRVGGPGYVIDKVAGEEANIHSVEFEGGVAAEVAVVGDGSTDLDLYILDEDGELVAMDEDDTDECYVMWKPRTDGLYYLTVLNRGKKSNEYALVTN